MKLTPKQKKFCEHYLKCGNATEAARQAGYSDRTAQQMGAENLTKPVISQYIAERMAKQDKTLIAGADEVMQFYTAVMRGEVKDQFQLDAALTDRLRAGDSLMKRYAAGERSQDALQKLDRLIKEFEDAVKSETD